MNAFTAALFAAAMTLPAAAQETGDPKLDFLGYCVASGNSSSYCACLTDTIGAAITPKELAIYTDYLKIIASGERDNHKIINKLKDDHDVKGKELATSLQAANDAAAAAEKSCAGL